jgi:hypothetical protein
VIIAASASERLNRCGMGGTALDRWREVASGCAFCDRVVGFVLRSLGLPLKDFKISVD